MISSQFFSEYSDRSHIWLVQYCWIKLMNQVTTTYNLFPKMFKYGFHYLAKVQLVEWNESLFEEKKEIDIEVIYGFRAHWDRKLLPAFY